MNVEKFIENWLNKKDVKCPHCDHEQNLMEHMPEEGVYEHFCDECDEMFEFEVFITYNYEVIDES